MWKISQVEKMTGVKRRDIQRVCDPNSRVHIFTPRESGPGKRSFDEDDILKIVLIGQYQDMGYTLPQIRRTFEEFADSEGGYSAIAQRQVEELEFKLHEIEQKLEFANELKMALAEDDLKIASEKIMIKRFVQSLFSSLYDLASDLDPSITSAEVDQRFDEVEGPSKEELINSLFLGDETDDISEIEVPEGFENDFQEALAAIDFKRADPDSAEVQKLIAYLVGFLSRSAEAEAMEIAKNLLAVFAEGSRATKIRIIYRARARAGFV